MLMPPRTGVTWPSNEVPAPKGDDGDVVGVAEHEELGDFLGGFDEGDGVGHGGGMRVLAGGYAVRAARCRW